MYLNQLCHKVGLKDSSDFIKKLEEIKEVTKDAIIVAADVVGIYLIISHNVGLEALSRTLDDQINKKRRGP